LGSDKNNNFMQKTCKHGGACSKAMVSCNMPPKICILQPLCVEKNAKYHDLLMKNDFFPINMLDGNDFGKIDGINLKHGDRKG